MTFIDEINECQLAALEVLLEIGGWATHWQLFNHGINSSSVVALERRGMVERRTVNDRAEWRVELTQLDEFLPLMKEGSVYKMLLDLSAKSYRLGEAMELQVVAKIFETTDMSVMQ